MTSEQDPYATIAKEIAIDIDAMVFFDLLKDEGITVEMATKIIRKMYDEEDQHNSLSEAFDNARKAIE